MKSPVRRSVNERSRPLPLRVGRVDALRRWMSRCSGTAASLIPGAMKPSRSVASSNTRPSAVPLQRGVAGAHELLELRLGLAQVACGEVCGLGAELELLVARDAREPERGARLQ